MSSGADVASSGGIGTSTGMIMVGAERRVSSWWPGGSTCGDAEQAARLRRAR